MPCSTMNLVALAVFAIFLTSCGGGGSSRDSTVAQVTQNPNDNSGQNPNDNSGQNPNDNSGQNPNDNSGQNPNDNSGQNPNDNSGNNENVSTYIKVPLPNFPNAEIKGYVIRLDFIDDNKNYKTSNILVSKHFDIDKIDSYADSKTFDTVKEFFELSDNKLNMRWRIGFRNNYAYSLASTGDTVRNLPTGLHNYGGNYQNSRNFVLQPCFSVICQKISFGTVELDANFDNFIGTISGNTEGYDDENFSLGKTNFTGNLNINSKDGSFSGSGKLSGTKIDTTYSIGIYGNFHGNFAEGVSGLYHNDVSGKTILGSFIASRN